MNAGKLFHPFLRMLLVVVLVASWGCIAAAVMVGTGMAAGSTIERVSVASDGTQANGGSGYPVAISADGCYVAFNSSATNLVDGDTNATDDIFVHDRETGTTERVSVASDGTPADNRSGIYSIALNADGRYVAFDFWTTIPTGDNSMILPSIVVHDREIGSTERVSVASDGTPADNESIWSALSGDGRAVAFWSAATNLVNGDTNDAPDIFVHDRETGTSERTSVTMVVLVLVLIGTGIMVAVVLRRLRTRTLG